MVEALVELGDLRGDLCELRLGLHSRPNDHAESVRADVAAPGVDASNAMVFVLAHVGHVVGLLVQPLPIEELLGLERASRVVSGPVRRSRFRIEAEVFTLTHAMDELLANELTNVLLRLSAQCNFDDLWAERGQLAFVLHKGADAALLVPNEQVLLGGLGVANSGLQLLEGERGPGSGGCVSFNHLKRFQCVVFFNYG